ncbi:transmembrane protein [Thalictrum thalictroides]|uniref:Transmembrane protein n=1 Tax=Thalictrum thalictroides TaxID=46969 RepID=A0A7J6WCF0_THATH|nr:transmembrane protein [Thalictrum thalictroides]
MADPKKPNSLDSTKIESSSKTGSYSGQKPHFPNPPDTGIPDTATLKEQWKFAIRQYSKWYSHAWGTAILAGVSFFALGWVIKGENPLPSKQEPYDHHHQKSTPPPASVKEQHP